MKRNPKTPPQDSTAEFERLLKKASSDARYELRLYVTGTSLRSTQAIANVHSLCEEYLAGRYDLVVIDIYQQPKEAAEDQIIAAPTLVKAKPIPPKKLIGDLSDRDRVIIGLNLVEGKSSGGGNATEWVKL